MKKIAIILIIILTTVATTFALTNKAPKATDVKMENNDNPTTGNSKATLATAD